MLLWAGLFGILLAVAGVPQAWKEIGFLFLGGGLVAMGVWMRTLLPPPRARRANVFEEARPPKRRGGEQQGRSRGEMPQPEHTPKSDTP